MIKLNKITVLNVAHPNVFTNGNDLEFIDMVFCIDYKVDVDTIDLNRYDFCAEDLNECDLKEEFASYMVVYMDSEFYENIDNMSYDMLDYRIVSDIVPEIEESNNKISAEEQKKALNLIKEYLKTDKFKREFNRAFN